MIRQNLITPWEWQRRLSQRIGGVFDPILNVIFETANKNPDSDGLGFPHLLNISALTDPVPLLSNPDRQNATPPVNTTNIANNGSNPQVIDMADGITIGDICVPLNEIYYITDLDLINKESAEKLK